MRRLKLQVQISVDGFISGPNGEMDWMTFDWDDDLKACVTEITTPIDCIVLGRKPPRASFRTGLRWLRILITRSLQRVRNLPTRAKSSLPKRLASQNGTIPHWQKATLATKSLG